MKAFMLICGVNFSIIFEGLSQIPPPPPPPPSTPFTIQTPPPISASTAIPQTSLQSAPTANSATVAKPIDPDRPLARVIEWVLEKGVSNQIDHSVAKLFGYGDRPVPTRQRGSKNIKDDTIRLFAVVNENGRTDVAIGHVDKDRNGYAWKTDASGKLMKTAHITDKGVFLIPNSEAEADFEAQKVYWLAKLAARRTENTPAESEQ